MSKIARGALAALLIAGTATTAMAQGAKLHTTPNSVKYKNTGAKPATGRSGSATLEARVLIAKDNSMLLEASTASVEGATHPGTITKMQVKIGSDFTQNHNGLNAGGYWTGTMPAAMRTTAIQLQANIKGIDPKRNDVVTVSTPALLRPDVSVLSVSGPQTQAPNTPVTFNANVVELNGDVGARAKCVLSIDGTAVDSADNIWVDAGGSVSCQFTRSFSAPGTYAVSVAATNVNPADWDATNNSASTSITIVNPNKTITGGVMHAYQSTYDYRYDYSRNGGNYCSYGYYYYCNYSVMIRYLDQYSQLQFAGYARATGPGIAQQFNAKILSNGAVSENVSFAPTYTSGSTSGDSYSNCAQYYSPAVWNGSYYAYGGYSVGMCSGGNLNDPANQWSSYWFNRFSGEVTYYGRDYYCDQWGNCDSYTWNDYSQTNGAGRDLGWTAGTQVGLQVEFVDSTGATHSADRSVTLTPSYDYTEQYGPESGWNEWDGNWFSNYYYRQFLGSGSTYWND